MIPKLLLKNGFLLVFFIVFQIVALSQETRVMFWNMENFFDPFVDSTRTYNEYTESGMQHWTMKRFYRKRNNLYKAILAVSRGKPLGIIGIAEVENEYVLNMLFMSTPLKSHNYRIVHYESPDRRGIDCALVYNIDEFQLITSYPIAIRSPSNKYFRSRDIVYAKFSNRKGDTLHCFVNHWPSRYGGERETVGLRRLAAHILRSKVDSIANSATHSPKIIIMGDLNDTPDDPSVKEVLICDSLLRNLFADTESLGFEGTLKHGFHWQVFDHIIISKALIDNDVGLSYKNGSASIFHADFLFTKDETYGGVKMFRTYIGPKYCGGYSDHLPVYIDLWNNSE